MYHRRFLIFTGVTVSAIMFKLTLLFVLIGSNSVKGEIAKTYIDCLDGGYPGRSSTLVCRVNGTVKYGIRLFRATGEQVVFCGLDHTDCFKTTGMTGYSATIDQTTKDVTLTITSFNIEMDVGTWTCTDGVKTGAVGTTCNKTVLTGPANITLIPPEPGEVTEGQSLDVTCDADCNPPCSFSWMLEQTEISNSSQLRLDNVKLNQNREVYTCIANNSKIPKSESINFTLTVKESTTTVGTTPSSTLSTSSSSSVSSNSPTAGSTTASTGSSTTSVNTSAPSQDLTNTFIAVGACAGILVCGITAAVCFCRKSKVCCFRKSVDKKKTSRDDSAVNETARPGSDVSYNSGFADTGPNYDNPSPAVLEATGLPDTNTSRVTQNFSHNPLADNQPPVRGSYKSEDNKYVFYSGSRNVDTNDVNGLGNNRFGGSDYYNQSKKDSRSIDRNIQMSTLERSYNTRI